SFGTGPLNVFDAAMRGGQRDVLALLTTQPKFGDWLKDEIGKYDDFKALSPKEQDKIKPVPRNPLNVAAESGQIDTVLWAIHALEPTEQAKCNLPDLLDKLMSAKPSPKVELQDAEKVYVFKKFSAGIKLETGQDLPLQSEAFSLTLKNAIEYGHHQLAAEMEKQGASLSKLSASDQTALKDQLKGTRVDLVKFTNPLLKLALKAGLIGEMMTGQAARRTPTLATDKNAHVTKPDLKDSKATLEYLAKGMAYAEDHITRNHKGRASRVTAWRSNVTGIVNQLGAIPSSKRSPEQQALLEAATLVSHRLHTMKSK
ncbi:MAG: hypothetical protein CVV27_08575, partial [Candidatus Melainabacteria bacterium HGW-Melainabacteria-1]